MDDNPEEQNLDLDLDIEMSDLRLTAIHSHEMYKELLSSGFSKSDAREIIGHVLYHAMSDLISEEEEDDDDVYQDEDDIDERDI